MNGSPSPASGAPRHPAELLEAHIPGLRRYAYALLRGDREGADDLVQDSLERALSCWHQRRADSDPRGWIYTILYHRFVTDQRRQRRYIGHRSLTEILEAEQPGVEGGQEEALAHRDLLRGFAELPEDQRSVLLLIAVEDFSYRETARVLGLPIGTVMSRLSRGRERLRQYMNGDQARARLGVTNDGDTPSDGPGGARLGRNWSAVRRTAATEGDPTIAD
jgi:RNA polymerase sigma-70 factor (ECF subfamily)